jgi:hypothetical protein
LRLAADKFVEQYAGGDGDVEGVGAAGHGEGDSVFTEGAQVGGTRAKRWMRREGGGSWANKEKAPDCRSGAFEIH